MHPALQHCHSRRNQFHGVLSRTHGRGDLNNWLIRQHVLDLISPTLGCFSFSVPCFHTSPTNTDDQCRFFANGFVAAGLYIPCSFSVIVFHFLSFSFFFFFFCFFLFFIFEHLFFSFENTPSCDVTVLSGMADDQIKAMYAMVDTACRAPYPRASCFPTLHTTTYFLLATTH